MPLLIEIDFGMLHDFDAALYRKLVALFKHQNGAHQIDLNLTPWADRNHLVQFLEYQKAMKAEQYQKSVEHQRKTEADKQAGKRRLLQYVSEQNLADTIENSNAISKWLAENTHGYVSSANIDVAIKILGPRGTNVLTWTPKVAPAPPTPPPPPVRYLENGEPELPINATEQQMKKASIAQLRDLSRRRGEGRQTWRHGWTGASL